MPTEPVYVAMVLASKVYSRREIRRILSGLGSTASGSRVVDNPVPQGRGGVVHVEVFKVLVLDSIQQRIWSRSLKFLFLRVGGEVAEVFKVVSQYRIQQRLWSRSLIFLPVAVFKVSPRARVLPHRVVCLRTLMMDFMWFFALFPG